MAETIEMPSVAIVSCGAIFVPLCPLVRECLSRATARENSIGESSYRLRLAVAPVCGLRFVVIRVRVSVLAPVW